MDAETPPRASFSRDSTAVSNAGGCSNDPFRNVKNIAKIYSRYLRRYPVVTKSISSAVVAIVGDIVARRLRGKGEAIAGRSTLAFGVFG